MSENRRLIFASFPKHFTHSPYQRPIFVLYFTATLRFSTIQLTQFLSKQFSISTHILINLSSTLFLHLPDLIYVPCNLSILFFINFHTSFFCNLIPSSQHLTLCILLPFNCSVNIIIPQFIFGGFTPTLTEAHTSIAHSTIVFFTCSHTCLTLRSSFHSTLLLSRYLVYPFMYWCHF